MREAEIAADDDDLRAGRADRKTVVAAELGNGLEVRHQPHAEEENSARPGRVEPSCFPQLRRTKWRLPGLRGTAIRSVGGLPPCCEAGEERPIIMERPLALA